MTSKSIVYYTCNSHKQEIEDRCRMQLQWCGLPIVSVSLNKKIDFGDERIVMIGSKSPLTMHKQILAGLKASKSDYVFLCENDVLYHPSHFDFTPPLPNVFYFNTNVYKQWEDGYAVWTDDLQQLSGMCGNRLFLLDYFDKRLTEIVRNGFDRHFEPKGNRVNWQSPFPNLDLQHDKNATKSHRTAEDFRNPKYAKGFRVVDKVPYWSKN